MNILVISNMYPGHDPSLTYKGIFVKEQVDSLRANNLNVETYIIDGHKGPHKYITDSIVILFKILKGNYDLIHCHYGLSAIFTLLLPFKKWSNVILTLHGGDILPAQGKHYQTLVTRKILPRIGFVITLNEEMNEIVQKLNSNFSTLPCGADETLFNSAYSHKDTKRILFPGKTDRPVKNYSFYNSVITEYKKTHPNVEEVILDGLTRNEVSEQLKQGALLLMTSISEGSPQIIKEALLSDLAIISSDVGDVANMISTTPGTLVYKNKTAKEVSILIDETIRSAEYSPGLRRARVFELNLNQKNVIAKLTDIYLGVFKNA